MANNPALIIASSATLNDPANAIPYLERDAILNAGAKGAKVCLDFADTYTWAGGTPAPGASLTDLARGIAPSTVGAVAPDFNAGGFAFTRNTDGTQRILLPDSAKLSATTSEFVLIVWISFASIPAAGTVSPSYLGWAAASLLPYALYFRDNTANANALQFAFAVNQTPVLLGGLSAATVYQLAVHAKINQVTGTTLRSFVNAALVDTKVGAAYTAMQQGTVQPQLGNYPNLGIGTGHTIYRSYLERIASFSNTETDVSGASADSQIALDYAANAGRFPIAA